MALAEQFELILHVLSQLGQVLVELVLEHGDQPLDVIAVDLLVQLRSDFLVVLVVRAFPVGDLGLQLFDFKRQLVNKLSLLQLLLLAFAASTLHFLGCILDILLIRLVTQIRRHHIEIVLVRLVMNDLREVVKLLDVSLALELGDDALQVADIRLSGQYGVNICSVGLAVQRVGNALLVRLGLQCFVHLLNVGLLLKLDQDVLEVLA